jgi:hypothetical protein
MAPFRLFGDGPVAFASCRWPIRPFRDGYGSPVAGAYDVLAHQRRHVQRFSRHKDMRLFQRFDDNRQDPTRRRGSAPRHQVGAIAIYIW